MLDDLLCTLVYLRDINPKLQFLFLIPEREYNIQRVIMIDRDCEKLYAYFRRWGLEVEISPYETNTTTVHQMILVSSAGLEIRLPELFSPSDSI